MSLSFSFLVKFTFIDNLRQGQVQQVQLLQMMYYIQVLCLQMIQINAMFYNNGLYPRKFVVIDCKLIKLGCFHIKLNIRNFFYHHYDLFNVS